MREHSEDDEQNMETERGEREGLETQGEDDNEGDATDGQPGFEGGTETDDYEDSDGVDADESESNAITEDRNA